MLLQRKVIEFKDTEDYSMLPEGMQRAILIGSNNGVLYLRARTPPFKERGKSGHVIFGYSIKENRITGRFVSREQSYSLRPGIKGSLAYIQTRTPPEDSLEGELTCIDLENWKETGKLRNLPSLKSITVDDAVYAGVFGSGELYKCDLALTKGEHVQTENIVETIQPFKGKIFVLYNYYDHVSVYDQNLDKIGESPELAHHPRNVGNLVSNGEHIYFSTTWPLEDPSWGDIPWRSFLWELDPNDFAPESLLEFQLRLNFIDVHNNELLVKLGNGEFKAIVPTPGSARLETLFREENNLTGRIIKENGAVYIDSIFAYSDDPRNKNAVIEFRE